MISVKKHQRFAFAGVQAVLILAESRPRLRPLDARSALLKLALEEFTGEHLDGAWGEMADHPLAGVCPRDPDGQDGWQLSRHVLVDMDSFYCYTISTDNRELMHFSKDVVAEFLGFVCALGHLPTPNDVVDRFVIPYQTISDELRHKASTQG